MSQPQFQVVGHRGNGSGRDENTLGSCQQALANGAEILELDIYMGDGQLMLGHPPRKRSDTLQNILDHIRVPLILHIKRIRGSRWHDRRVIEALAPVSKGRDITVSSFWPGTLRFAKRHHPDLRTAFVTTWAGYDVHLAPYLGVSAIHGWHRTVTRRAVQRAHANGLSVMAFVAPGDQRTKNRMERLGLDGVITNNVRAYARPSVASSAPNP